MVLDNIKVMFSVTYVDHTFPMLTNLALMMYWEIDIEGVVLSLRCSTMLQSISSDVFQSPMIFLLEIVR